MPRLTKEQFVKWSNGAGNGFFLDVNFYCIWGEKQLVRGSAENSGISYKVTVCYHSRNGKNQPVIEVDRQIAIEGSSLCRVVRVITENIGEPQNRKNFKVLQQIAHDLDFDAWVEKAKAKDSGKSWNDPADFMAS